MSYDKHFREYVSSLDSESIKEAIKILSEDDDKIEQLADALRSKGSGASFFDAGSVMQDCVRIAAGNYAKFLEWREAEDELSAQEGRAERHGSR